MSKPFIPYGVLADMSQHFGARGRFGEGVAAPFAAEECTINLSAAPRDRLATVRCSDGSSEAVVVEKLGSEGLRKALREGCAVYRVAVPEGALTTVDVVDWERSVLMVAYPAGATTPFVGDATGSFVDAVVIFRDLGLEVSILIEPMYDRVCEEMVWVNCRSRVKSTDPVRVAVVSALLRLLSKPAIVGPGGHIIPQPPPDVVWKKA